MNQDNQNTRPVSENEAVWKVSLGICSYEDIMGLNLLQDFRTWKVKIILN